MSKPNETLITIYNVRYQNVRDKLATRWRSMLSEKCFPCLKLIYIYIKKEAQMQNATKKRCVADF